MEKEMNELIEELTALRVWEFFSRSERQGELKVTPSSWATVKVTDFFSHAVKQSERPRFRVNPGRVAATNAKNAGEDFWKSFQWE